MVKRHYGTYEGTGLTLGIIAADFNPLITGRLLDGCVETLERHGVDPEAIHVWHVPGSFEMPTVARQLAASGHYDALICLGAVIRGETDHYDHVCRAAADGIARVGFETGLPTIFGVITTETVDQALVRAGGKGANRGSEAAEAALAMVSLRRQWQAE